MSKIINFSDKIKEKLKNEINEILMTLREDYELDVIITKDMIDVILDEFYNIVIGNSSTIK